MRLEEQIQKMREYELDILVDTFYKESQVGRSLYFSRKEIDKYAFKNSLRQAIKKLREMADGGTIKNTDIRMEIRKLSEDTGVSIGQSQKVINVYLKFYCLLLNRPLELLRELDCPLDSTTMNGRDKMKDVKTMERYESYQKEFEKMHAIRVLRDEEYDLKRLAESFRLGGRKD